MSNMLGKIQNELKMHSKIKVISFDIFDTILFRMVCRPVDVFEIVGKRALENGYLAEYISPVIYRNLRIEAERKARDIKKKKCGSTEVILEEIIEALPDYCCNKKELLLLELETENELCYLNTDMYDVVEYLHRHDEYRVILTSDMYLSSKNIRKILENCGLKLSIVDNIYISCEIEKNKRSGELYKYIVADNCIEANEILHIGDNYISDIVNAQSLGLHTLHYNVISSENNLELIYEEMKFGKLAPEVYSLRKLLIDKAENIQSDNQIWYLIGASTMGPLMAGMAEWVLDVAEKEEIYNIYPLMREGKIISRLLQQEAESRQKDFNIKPMYISRKATFVPGIREWNKENFDKIMDIQYGTIGTVLEFFELDCDELEKVSDVLLVDCGKEKLGDITVKEYLYNYLFQYKVQEKINKKIQSETDKLFEYLEKLGIRDKFITVDLGMKGTMQQILSCLLKEKGYNSKTVHLLMFGHYKNLYKMLDEVDIRGYVGSAGNQENITFDVSKRHQIWEQLMMCEEGTTIGYTSDGNPITKKMESMDEKQLEKIEWCQKGMLEFQKLYITLRQKKGYNKLRLNPVDLAQIALRMIQLPSESEAKELGNLNYDENFGVNTVDKICSAQNQVNKENLEEFIENSNPGEIIWTEGLVTQIDRTYYINKLLDYCLSDYEKTILRIVKKVLRNNPNSVVVSGAGEAGRIMQKFLNLYGVNIEAFTDGNEKLHGSMINGIPVKSVRDSFGTKHYVIASFAYAEEIEEQIKKYHDDIVVYTC